MSRNHLKRKLKADITKKEYEKNKSKDKNRKKRTVLIIVFSLLIAGFASYGIISLVQIIRFGDFLGTSWTGIYEDNPCVLKIEKNGRKYIFRYTITSGGLASGVSFMGECKLKQDKINNTTILTLISGLLANDSEVLIFDGEKLTSVNDKIILYKNNDDNDISSSDIKIEKYSQEIILNPDDASAYIKRGDVYMDKKDYDKAIFDFSRAIFLDPNSSKAYYNRGVAYSKNYDRTNNSILIENAIKDFTEAISLNPNDKYTYFQRGLAYGNISKYDESINDYTQVIQLDQNYANAYNNRGNAYYQINKYDEAIEDCTKAILLNPNLPNAYYIRGNVYMDKIDYEKAITDFEETLRINPDFPYVQESLNYAKEMKLNK